jgi:hypothetical protein
MRTAKNEPKSRLNLEMPEAVREQLEQLRVRTHSDSLAEVFRRSLALYDLLWSAKERGASILIKDGDGTKEVLIL